MAITCLEIFLAQIVYLKIHKGTGTWQVTVVTMNIKTLRFNAMYHRVEDLGQVTLVVEPYFSH